MGGYNTLNQAQEEFQMSIRQKITQFVSYQRTVRELQQLDSIQLRDLGITRDQIKTVARGGSIV